MSRALRRRYGRAHGLKWSELPGGHGAHTMLADGRLFSVLFDQHKRKWTLLGTNGEFLGSAIRKSDAKKIAQQIENGRA